MNLMNTAEMTASFMMTASHIGRGMRPGSRITLFFLSNVVLEGYMPRKPGRLWCGLTNWAPRRGSGSASRTSHICSADPVTRRIRAGSGNIRF